VALVHVTCPATQPAMSVHAPHTRSALAAHCVAMYSPLGQVVEQATQAPLFE
jgi:hypothetical protein